MIVSLQRDWESAERVDFEQARALTIAFVQPLGVEAVALAAASGRIAAEPLCAADDLVPFARSSMDGYALRAADTPALAGAGVMLPVVGATYAGERSSNLPPGSARAIATGAPLPAGADAVIPIEQVHRRGDAIVVNVSLRVGQHVFAAGDDAKRGDVLVSAGDVITPGRAALLAAAGHANVPVYRRPRVAIVSTGDELVEVTQRPGPGQIRNSNAAMLAAHLARDGADLVLTARVADSRPELHAALRRALAASDVVITTGGASVGERDLVKDTFAALGARFAFRSVALRPAKPTAFARYGRTQVAVLPGNPAAAFVAYSLLVRGVIRRLAGQRDAHPASVVAALAGTLHAKPERHFAVFGRLTYERGNFTVVPLGNQCSSLVRTSADANALIVVPPGAGRLVDGDAVSVEVLDWNAVAFGG